MTSVLLGKEGESKKRITWCDQRRMCASFADGDWLGRRPGRSGGRPSSSANLKHGRRGVAWRGEDERREERRVGGNGEEGRWPRWVWSEEKEKLKDAEQQWHGWSFQTHSMQQQHQQPPQDQGPFSWPSQVSWPTLGPGRARRKQRARLEWAVGGGRANSLEPASPLDATLCARTDTYFAAKRRHQTTRPPFFFQPTLSAFCLSPISKTNFKF